MEELIKVLQIGFAIIGASLMTLIIMLYVKLSNLEDIISQKAEKEGKMDDLNGNKYSQEV